MKERQAATDEMFEPLKRTIELLKTYDQEMPDEVHQQLQVTGGGGEGGGGGGGRWVNLVKGITVWIVLMPFRPVHIR